MKGHVKKMKIKNIQVKSFPKRCPPRVARRLHSNWNNILIQGVSDAGCFEQTDAVI
jgi:hypothetical protein